MPYPVSLFEMSSLSVMDSDSSSPAPAGCGGSPPRPRPNAASWGACPPTPERTPPPFDLRNRTARKAKIPLSALKLSLGLPPLTPTPTGAQSPDNAARKRAGGASDETRELLLRRPSTPGTPCLGRLVLEPENFASPMRCAPWACLEEPESARNPFSPTPCSEVSHLSSRSHEGSARSHGGCGDFSYLSHHTATFPRALPSARLAGDYEDLVCIGTGVSSEVYKARSRLTGLMYAVKEKKHHIRGAKERENQLQEVYALSASDHPHIVRFQSSWIEDEALYLVTEYCAGGSVSQEAWSRGQPAREWSERELLELMGHVADALAFIHSKNMAHMDLKMDNVFIVPKGGDHRVYKLGDFGLVRMIDGDSTRYEGLNESEGDSRYVDGYLLNHADRLREADVFSLGASIYELARQRPLASQGADWAAVRSGAPDLLADLPGCGAALRTILARMLHPDPAQRPTAFEVYSFAVAAQADPRDTLRTELDLMRVKYALLEAEVRTLHLLRAAEERRVRRPNPDAAGDDLLCS